MRFDHVLTNLRLLALDGTEDGDRVQPGLALGVRDGRIAAIAPVGDLASAQGPRLDLEGRLVSPALVDGHTHVVFAGDRSDEWARRMAGESYAEIARAGGGILATVRATRSATEEELVAGAARRLRTMARGGVATVEVKSGYGLDVESELRILRAARAAGVEAGIRVVPTLLAAHAIPPEYAARRRAYLDEVCLPLVRAVADEGLATAVDAFRESIGFTAAEVTEIFRAAREAGLAVKLHADQLADGEGAALAAEWDALSADHLEHTSGAGVRALAKAGTTAVLLPGAFLGVRESRRPPVDQLRKAGVPMAVATDANPGSSPLLSLLTAAHLSCALFGLTAAEALRGITVNAARALGMDDEMGSVLPGRRADLAVWDVDRPAELVQWLGAEPLHGLMIGGAWKAQGGPGESSGGPEVATMESGT